MNVKNKIRGYVFFIRSLPARLPFKALADEPLYNV